MTPAKKRILVIDNDPASTRMVRLTLERQPTFEVRELRAGCRRIDAGPAGLKLTGRGRKMTRL